MVGVPGGAATRKALLLPVLLFLIQGVMACSASPDAWTPAVSRAHEQLWDLFDREWRARLQRNPLMATSVGDHRYNDRLPDVSLAALAEHAALRRGFLAELNAIDLDDLDDGDRINVRIFRRQIEEAIAFFEFGDHQMPINADSGFHMGFAQLHRSMPFLGTLDYQNYIARLKAAPDYFAQQIANMRAGLERGFSVPQVSLAGYEATIEPHLVDDATESVLWAPFESFPVAIPQAKHEQLQQSGRSAILEGVVPAYQAFHDFFVEEYLPRARATLAAIELPDGLAYYQEKVRSFTTLEISPGEVHQIGLDEVARIRAEMDEVVAGIEFHGSFTDFLTMLRTNPDFYPRSGAELLREASYIAKRMDGRLPKLFATLPRVPYTVEPVPDHIAPKYTSGRYVPPTEGGTEPGIYWVNVHNLDSRPFYALEALTLHEAVPGHHLQNALASEQDDQPPFRRFSYLSAFGEGWGLYSEWLGLEAGFYQDPYSNFGRLTYEMWRACRLVVDTGVHSKGWTRQQVIDYMASNTALSLHEVTTETDRYIAWPAQALAYKMGQLEILRLRRLAEERLGQAFDVRRFHDTVLVNGSVPLDVLADLVESWIEREVAG
ncbi:MAG: DUF885 domain-containing protein [Acidobacteriota bacterium]|nr:DUF885 domain-containing protein [Acidobacteriota bacterium]